MFELAKPMTTDTPPGACAEIKENNILIFGFVESFLLLFEAIGGGV